MITAKIIADSISESGKRITTFEWEYPRFIHSEVMTHRMLSKNSASSRAIPLKTMISMVWNNPAHPIHWGKNQAGMQAEGELTGFKLWAAKKIWFGSGKIVCGLAWLLGKTGVHKQIANRILEPWSHIKIVVSGTDWDNLFHLRNHKMAQPEFHELARQSWGLYSTSKPRLLKAGEWHLPYITLGEYNGDVTYWSGHDRMSLEDAQKLSASLCAQVSFRKSDDTLDKALKIYDRLVGSTPKHASPFEHQATPLEDPTEISGNFRGWLQLRQTIKDNVCLKYNG